MLYNIEIKDKPGVFDAVGQGIKKDIFDLGIKSVSEVRFVQVYIIEASVSEQGIRKICEELLTDRVSQDYVINSEEKRGTETSPFFVIEVAYNPGVMDPVEESALKGIKDLRVEGVTAFKTAKKYLIKGSLNDGQLKIISEKLLYNKLIQHIVKSPSHQVTKSQVNFRF